MLEDSSAFPTSKYGAGQFGAWTTDANGLPLYVYQASLPTRLDVSARDEDHWHFVGNHYVGATVHNGGYVVIYDAQRAWRVMNPWRPRRGNFAGGFLRVELEGTTFVTLFPLLPRQALQTRAWGLGYADKTTEYRGIRFYERTLAPERDVPWLLRYVVVENLREAPVTLQVAEIWQPQPEQLFVAPAMRGPFGKLFWGLRRLLAKGFLYEHGTQDDRAWLAWRPRYAGLCSYLDVEKPHWVDFASGTFSVWMLDAEYEGVRCQPFLGKEIFNEATGAGVLFNEDFPPLGFQTTLQLEPKSRREMTFAIGTHFATSNHLHVHKPAIEKPTCIVASPQRPGFSTTMPSVPWLSRELVWHRYYLDAGVYRSAYFDAPFIDQGSAYTYLQGLSGAHRDYCLYILPMVYLDPPLAKDLLRFELRAQAAANGKLPYGHFGFAKAGGFGLHSFSSDLDLFFLWAITEYLEFTRDVDFLREVHPYYPKHRGRMGTTLEHIRLAFDHLQYYVGRGPHGLVRCGTGDWNDALLAYSPFPPLTIRRGESTLNTALAAYVLSRLVKVLEPWDRDLTERMQRFAEYCRHALRMVWNECWFARGYTGWGDRRLGDDRLFLDTQPFALLAGVLNDAESQTLLEQIEQRCIQPQRIGARCLWQPFYGGFLEPGSDTNGGTWAAIDSWLTLAWSRRDPVRAWSFFLGTTLAAHAEAFPEIWYGIWSGPDSYNADYHPRPGETFDLHFTPMVEFPVMNMNRHAGPLYAFLGFLGIEATEKGLRIDPRLPLMEYDIQMSHFGLRRTRDEESGYYRPVCSGQWEFEVVTREGYGTFMAWVGDVPVAVEKIAANCWRFRAACEKGSSLSWRYTVSQA